MIVIPTRLWPSDVMAPQRGTSLMELDGQSMGTGWSVRCYAPAVARTHLLACVEAEMGVAIGSGVSVAKGYAVDHLCGVLAGEGLVSYLVQIGGALRARGVKPDGVPWWITIESPVSCELEIQVALTGCSIATCDGGSGASVSVIHADCIAAEAWANALTRESPDQGVVICREEGIAAVYVVRDPFRVVTSAAFNEMVS